MRWSAEPLERIKRTSIIWEALAWKGYEHLCLDEWSGVGGYSVDGLIVAVLEDQPSRIWYRIELDEAWVFKGLRIYHTLESSEIKDNPLDLDDRNLELVRTPEGIWDHDIIDDVADLSDCTDIDIAVTPFTNTLPIRRLGLLPGESVDITVAYVTVPELLVAPALQRYTCLGPSSYRFENLESGFTADITVDDDGLVSAYPGLFRRIWPI